jgi:hypothetical protein
MRVAVVELRFTAYADSEVLKRLTAGIDCANMSFDPVPTISPKLLRAILATPFTLHPSVLVAGKYMPLPAAEFPVTRVFAAVIVPVVAAFVPSNVNPVPLASVPVPLA